jgi:hypothetical protein
MVMIGDISMYIGQHLIVAAKDVGPAIEQMKPAQRVAVIMALLGLTLIGLFLVTFIMVGGHWVRRLARHRPRSTGTSTNAADETTTGGDVPQIVLPDENSGDTMLLDRASKETKIE